jgi:hypothetical protein
MLSVSDVSQIYVVGINSPIGRGRPS